MIFYRPLDESYFAGIVKHLLRDGQIIVLYDDDVKEGLIADDEFWKYESSSNQLTVNSKSITVNSPRIADAESEMSLPIPRHF